MPISRSWSRRGTKINEPCHGDSPLLWPTGIQIATKSLPGPTKREHRKLIGVRTMSLGTNYSFYDCLAYCQYFIIWIINTSYREDCLRCCPAHPTSHQKCYKRFSSSRRVTRRQVMRRFTGNGTDQCRNDSSNVLNPYREQPRSTRIVVAYPRSAFSGTKQQITLHSVLINKPKFLKATHHTKIRKTEIPRSMVVEA